VRASLIEPRTIERLRRPNYDEHLEVIEPREVDSSRDLGI
jgi:hypothetical protein